MLIWLLRVLTFTAGSGTLNFDATNPTREIVIDILGDAIPEHPETFTVTLSNPGTGAKLGANSSAKGTIQNDDGTGIRIADAQV